MKSSDLMIQEFGNIRIDEEGRELRVDGKTVDLQPRLFDLLIYLVKNRDHVASKNDILDEVWPDVIVADGALQRAVSLLRSALGGDAQQVIKTFPRRGYRFFPPENAIETQQSNQDLSHLDPDKLKDWARRIQCHGRDEIAADALAQLIATASKKGDRIGAAWATILLLQIRLEWGDFVVAKGWYHRARRLLAEIPVGRERGYLDYLGSRIAAAENDLENSLLLAEQARAIGEKIGDADLENLGLVATGEASLFLGKVSEGLSALEEAGAAVSGGSLSSWASGIVFCGLIYSCMTRSDWRRAGEWTEQFTEWGNDKSEEGYPGLCRLHRAEILAIQGKLTEAETEANAAWKMLERQAPWTEGEVRRVQGELAIAKGDFKSAAASLARAMEAGWDTQLEIAMLRLAEGNSVGAARLLAQAMEANAYSCRSRRGKALAYLAIAQAATGELTQAKSALAEIKKHPELTSTPALQAQVLCARAEVFAAEGSWRKAISHMHLALRSWLEIGAPLPAAHARRRLAKFYIEQGEHQLAAMELSIATAAFQEAGAQGWVELLKSG